MTLRRDLQQMRISGLRGCREGRRPGSAAPASQPPRLRARALALYRVRVAAMGRRRASSISISTASSSSTTRSGMRRAMRCSSISARSCSPMCATATWSAVSAATSSACCSSHKPTRTRRTAKADLLARDLNEFAGRCGRAVRSPRELLLWRLRAQSRRRRRHRHGPRRRSDVRAEARAITTPTHGRLDPAKFSQRASASEKSSLCAPDVRALDGRLKARAMAD